MKKVSNINFNVLIIAVLIVSFVLKFIYVDKVAYYISPHDLGIDTETEEIYSAGHLDYIKYIAENKAFPDSVDKQFYQPPLFHV